MDIPILEYIVEGKFYYPQDESSLIDDKIEELLLGMLKKDNSLRNDYLRQLKGVGALGSLRAHLYLSFIYLFDARVDSDFDETYKWLYLLKGSNNKDYTKNFISLIKDAVDVQYGNMIGEWFNGKCPDEDIKKIIIIGHYIKLHSRFDEFDAFTNNERITILKDASKQGLHAASLILGNVYLRKKGMIDISLMYFLRAYRHGDALGLHAYSCAKLMHAKNINDIRLSIKAIKKIYDLGFTEVSKNKYLQIYKRVIIPVGDNKKFIDWIKSGSEDSNYIFKRLCKAMKMPPDLIISEIEA